jgi:hypothetical protein
MVLFTAAAGGCGMTSTSVQLSQLWAVEQGQQLLEFAAIVGGGVELEGKSASIKSSSDCIQLSIRKNERKGESDEPDTPLLGEVDVDIGGKQQGFAIEPQPPRRRRGIQIPKSLIVPNQAEPASLDTALVHMYFSVHRRFCS